MITEEARSWRFEADHPPRFPLVFAARWQPKVDLKEVRVAIDAEGFCFVADNGRSRLQVCSFPTLRYMMRHDEQDQSLEQMLATIEVIMTPTDLGAALKLLRDGKAVSRRGWNGKSMWLKLQVPDAHSKMSLPYIYMRTATGQLVPWLASQSDLLADDWVEVEDDEAVLRGKAG
jgi:uncharacterized membrane protein